MIYLRLSGGLGNQLYQLAAAALLSARHSEPVVPFFDGLQKYAASRRPDSISLLAPNHWLRLDASAKRSCVRWLSVSARAGRVLPLMGVSDQNFWGVIERKTPLMPLFLDGYFQRGWTQESFTQVLAAMPIKPIPAAAAARIDSDEVVIHIRGGDFLKLPRFQVVDASFYVRATRQALEKGWRRFAVITDDPVYAGSVRDIIAAQISAASLRLLPRGSNTLADFDTIRAAPALIIGNSTFAWWGAALSNSETPTWSPTKMIIDAKRDFYLPFETPIDVSTQ